MERVLDDPPPNRVRALGISLVVLFDVAMAGAGGWLMWRHFTQEPEILAAPAPVVAVATKPVAPPPRPVAVHRPPANPTPPPVRGNAPTSLPAKSSKLPPKPASLPSTWTSEPIPDAGVPPEAEPVPDAAPRLPFPEVLQPPDAQPGGGEAITEGVRKVVAAHRRDVTECYRRAARSFAGAQRMVGTVELHVEISGGGTPRDVRVASNGTGSDELANCLVGLMASWQYPPHDGPAVVLAWPFTFRAR